MLTGQFPHVRLVCAAPCGDDSAAASHGPREQDAKTAERCGNLTLRRIEPDGATRVSRGCSTVSDAFGYHFSRAGVTWRARCEPHRLDRSLPRAGRASDWRSRRQHVRVAPVGGADRYDWEPIERIAGARSRHPMGGRRDEARRPRERPHRARDGAAMGARRRECRNRHTVATTAHDAWPRRQRRHAV